MSNHCTEKLVAFLCASDGTVPFPLSKLRELYAIWKIPPKRSLPAFLSSYPEIFHVDEGNVTLNPTYEEFVCLSRLEQILIELTTNGPVDIFLLGVRHMERFGIGYWKRSLPTFLAEHPDMFFIDGDNVEMVATYAANKCVSRFAQLLHPRKKPLKMDISIVEDWYNLNFGPGYWKQLPGVTLKSFLARHSNDFVVNGKQVTVRITEAQCLADLRRVLESASGNKMKSSDLAALYPGLWEKFPGETFKSFVTRHSPKIFIVDGEEVTLRITEAQFITNLRHLLESASEKKMHSSELGSLYKVKYNHHDWKSLGKKFEAFLKEHPNDFQFSTHGNITLVARKSTASHNDINSSEFNDNLTYEVDGADGSGDSLSLNAPFRTSTTESSSTQKTSFWDESEESTWTTYSVADDLPTTSSSTILPAAAEPYPAPTTFNHLHPPAPEPWQRRPARPAVSVVNFRIADIIMPNTENRVGAWRTTVSSETLECDDADANDLTSSDLASESPFLEHAWPPLVSSFDSHDACGVRAAGPSKDRHHLAFDASWDLDAERGGATIEIGDGMRRRRRSGLHERLKQSDPASRVGILEGLLEMERRRNELERQRNRDARDRIGNLERLIVEREQEIEYLRDKIDRMEEIMAVEGSMRGLELNAY